MLYSAENIGLALFAFGLTEIIGPFHVDDEMVRIVAQVPDNLDSSASGILNCGSLVRCV